MQTRTIYVIGVTDNPVKIGMASNVKARLESLQVGCPDELVLYHRRVAPVAIAKIIESLAHKELKQFHRRGEWFDVSAEVAILTVERIANGMIEEFDKAVASGTTISLDDLIGQRVVDVWAREAFARYKEKLQTVAGRPMIEAYHRAIRRSAGADALMAFMCWVSDRMAFEDLRRRQPATFRKSRLALIEALNALAAYYCQANEATLLDEISKIVA